MFLLLNFSWCASRYHRTREYLRTNVTLMLSTLSRLHPTLIASSIPVCKMIHMHVVKRREGGRNPRSRGTSTHARWGAHARAVQSVSTILRPKNIILSDCPTLRLTQVGTLNHSTTTPFLIKGVALIYATPLIKV